MGLAVRAVAVGMALTATLAATVLLSTLATPVGGARVTVLERVWPAAAAVTVAVTV